MTYPSGPKMDYVQEALSRLLEQYKRKPVFAALVTAFANLNQQVELATWEVILYCRLNTAEAAQLQQIGRVVGVEQGSLTDIAFRREIATAILIIKSQGTPTDIQKVAALTLPISTPFDYRDEKIASVRLSVNAPLLPADVAQAYRLLNVTRQGGVRLLLTTVGLGQTVDTTLTVRDHRTPGVSVPQALSDYHDTVPRGGGTLRGAIASS